MAVKPLTPRQGEALEFIKTFVASKGYPPTIREIADHMHYQSSSTAFSILEVLVRKGFIKKGNGPRELQVIGFETMAEKDAEISRLRETLNRICEESSEVTISNIAFEALHDDGETHV